MKKHTLTLALAIAISGMLQVACNPRSEKEENPAITLKGNSQELAPREIYLGQPFDKWLPELSNPNFNEYHYHPPHIPAQYIREWVYEEGLKICDVPLNTMKVTREGIDFEEAVLGLEIEFSEPDPELRLQHFFKLTKQLFQMDEPTDRKELEYSLHLKFGDKGEASLHGTIEARFWLWNYEGRKSSKVF